MDSAFNDFKTAFNDFKTYNCESCTVKCVENIADFIKTAWYTKLELILILIGIDGAEGEVLGRGDLGLGQNVEECGLADVGKADNTALEVGAQTAQDDDLLLHFLLLGRHSWTYLRECLESKSFSLNESTLETSIRTWLTV